MIRTSAVTALTIAAFAVTSVAGAAIASASPGVPVPAFDFRSHLDSLLLTPGSVAGITGADGMKVVGSSTEFADTSDAVDAVECIGAFEPGQRAAYDDSGSVSLVTKVLADGRPGSATHFANQTIVEFADRDAAAAYIAAAAQSWSDCRGRTVTLSMDSGEQAEWKLGEAELRRDNTVLVTSQTAGSSTCERALAGYDKYVVDAMACNYQGGEPAGQAEQIVLAVTAQVATDGEGR